jgi:hypothetical protein
MATTPNYGFIMPDPTDFVTDLPADFEIFGDEVDSRIKALNPETTAGDIAYRGATANAKVRLGIGTVGQVLTVNSGATAPEWASPASGSLTQLATQDMAGLNTVTFSTISQGYRALVLQGTGLYLNASNTINVRWNGITSGVYQFSRLRTDSANISNSTAQTSSLIGYTAANTTRTGNFWVTFNNYTVNDQTKMYAGVMNIPADNNGNWVVGSANNSAGDAEDAITDLTILTTTNLTAGTITLYGVN